MDRELTVHIRLEGADELHQALDRIAIHAERVSERVRTLYRENPPDNIDRHDEFLDSLPEAAKIRMATYDGRLDQRTIDEGQMDAGLWPSHGGSQ